MHIPLMPLNISEAKMTTAQVQNDPHRLIFDSEKIKKESDLAPNMFRIIFAPQTNPDFFALNSFF